MFTMSLTIQCFNSQIHDYNVFDSSVLELTNTCLQCIRVFSALTHKYMFRMYMIKQCFNSQMCRTPMLVVEEHTTPASTGLKA